MGKNRFLDDILSEAKQYYNEHKIIGGASKSTPDLYTQFSNLMAGVAIIMTGAMELNNSIPIAVAVAVAASSSPSPPVSTNVDSSIPIGVAVSAVSNGGGGGGGDRDKDGDITSSMKVIIEKAKILSENLKSILDKFIKEQKETQGDLDEETGKIILGEPKKSNAIILTQESTSYLPDYKDGLINDDIVFRK